MKPDASLRELARAAGISTGTARDVRARVASGEDPVPERLRAAEDPRAAAAQAMREPPVADVEQAVRRLMRDPSLRARESGRMLLRMLRSPDLDSAQWLRVSSDVPAHCAPLVGPSQ